MYQGKTATQQLKDKDETPIVMVHAVNINETKTLCLPIEEEWRQATSEDHDLGFIKSILSVLEEAHIGPN